MVKIILLAAALALFTTSTDKQTSPIFPFADFDAGNHSYATGWTSINLSPIYHGALALDFYRSIVRLCNCLGNFAQPASKEARQLLAAREVTIRKSDNWNVYGQHYIYTDALDYEDPMQACIQNISNRNIG